MHVCLYPFLSLAKGIMNKFTTGGMIESLIDVKEFIKEGVTFGGMLHSILEISCENRLSVLYHRLMKSPGILAARSSSQVC